MRTLTAALVVVGFGVGAPSRLGAQWEASAELGIARFGGTSHDSSGATIGPYRPTTVEVRLGRSVGRLRAALGVVYAKTGLAAEGEGVAVVQYDVGSLWEIAPEVSFCVARFGTGLRGWVGAGPAIDFWDLDGERRNRVGGRASILLEWPLARSLAGSVRVGGVWSRSIFNPEDVPADVERVSTRRFGVGLGLRYRL